jgi:branched-chain amino acid transport system substrate-binding protein
VKKAAFLTLLSVSFFIVINSATAQIKLGIPGPLTGDSEVFGEQYYHGASQAIEDINAMGGVLSNKIVPVTDDDMADPKQAEVVANNFAKEGVNFVVGHFSSDTTLPASVIYQNNNILEITASATNPLITERSMWNIFRTCGRDDQQGAVAGSYIAAHFRDKPVAIVYADSVYGQGLAQETKKAINKAGIKEVLYESIQVGQTDFTDIVTKITSLNAGIVFFAGEHTEGALLVKELQPKGILMMGGDGLSTNEFGEIAGDTALGTLMTFSPDPRTRPEAKRVVEEFRAKKYEPEAYTLYAYAAVQVIKQAADAAKSIEPKKIAAQIITGTKFKTAIGELDYDTKGDITRFDYVMYKWIKLPSGKLTYVQTE